MEEEREPWVRQKREGSKPYQAFDAYRRMGPKRSREKVAAEVGKSLSMVSKWSARWEWRLRALAWDDFDAKERRESEIAASKDMAERHASLSLMMQGKIAKRLQMMNDREVSEMSIGQIGQILESAVRVERLSRGEHTEKTAMRVHETSIQERETADIDYTRLSDEELATLDHLLAKAAGEGQPDDDSGGEGPEVTSRVH